jgi:HEAT repeat protein
MVRSKRTLIPSHRIAGFQAFGIGSTQNMRFKIVTLMVVIAICALAMALALRLSEDPLRVHARTLLSDKNVENRKRAIDAMGDALALNRRNLDQGPILTALLAAAEDESPTVRVKAVFSFFTGLSHSSETIRTLSQLAVHDGEARVRFAAISVLGDLGRRAPATARDGVVSVLATCLHDPNMCAELLAASALVRMGRGEIAVPMLAETYRQKDSGTRSWAIRILTETRLDSPPVIAVLEKALKDESSQVRLQAGVAFAKTGHRAQALEAMKSAEADRDPISRLIAKEILGLINPIDDGGKPKER